MRISWQKLLLLFCCSCFLVVTIVLTGIQLMPLEEVPPPKSSLSIPLNQLPEKITIPLDLAEESKPFEMVLVRPGTYSMGCEPAEIHDLETTAWPRHSVKISQPFYLGIYEVTQAHWQAAMGERFPESRWVPNGPNFPVAKVNWNQVQKFIDRLNLLNQGVFRLPTEAEWEYACRAGTDTRYSFGNEPRLGTEHMWWIGEQGKIRAKEVGLKIPNPWGFYDIHGNVGEWCSDRWEKAYPRERQVDPQGPPQVKYGFLNYFPTPASNYVIRGSCYQGGDSCSRWYEQAFDTHYSVGFRLAANAETGDQLSE